MPDERIAVLMGDVQGSTRLWELAPASMSAAMRRHDALVEQVAGRALVKPRGEGDSIFAAFENASAAIAAALRLQTLFLREAWPEPIVIRSRMAVHVGTAELRDDDYYGAEINRCARLRALAHGGQILLSRAAVREVQGRLPPGCQLRELGALRLKDIARSERVAQLTHPDLPADFPPPAAAERPVGNLPAGMVPLIGRESEVAEMRARLRRARLVTLTGTGGAGKTTLALAVARGLADGFSGGAWLADLAPLRGPLAARAVADAFGLGEEPGRPLLETVAAHIGEAKMLVVVDNCEHVLDDCALVVGELLRRCGGLRILATSRECLGLLGEQQIHVGPLAVPERGADRTAALATGAVALLVDRIERAGMDQPLEDNDVAALADVCRRLDGLPLALELAAPRAAAFGAAALRESLGDVLALRARRAASERQRSLRALLDWSYDLLADEERLLFRRLAVFAGRFRLEAVEGICTGAAVTASLVPDLLEQLVHKSLVVVEKPGGGFRLLETIRDYAREQLDAAGEAADLRERHADWHLQLCARAQLSSADTRVWLERLEEALDDTRAMLERLMSAGRAADGLAMLAHTRAFWATRHAREARFWIERLLEQAGPLPPRQQARTYAQLARLLAEAGEHRAASKRLEQALEAADMQADPTIVVEVLNQGVAVATLVGELDLLRQFAHRALAAARASDDRRALLLGHTCMGSSLFFGGPLEESMEHYQAAERLAREFDSEMDVADALYNQGEVADMLGDYALARSCYEEGFAIWSRLALPAGEGDFARRLALARLRQGDLARAWSSARRALEIERDLARAPFATAAMAICGCILEALRDDEPAALVLGAAAAARSRHGDLRLDDETALSDAARDKLVERLGSGLYQSLGATGEGWSTAEALAFALALDPLSRSTSADYAPEIESAERQA